VGSQREELTVVVVSYSGKEINAKLVYYGAGLCGKTTNLESIYEAVPDTSRGKMVSMKTQSDRTLFFDLLPLSFNTASGLTVRVKLFTVPGQVIHNSTRKLVLQGADGVAFIADSQVQEIRANQASFKDLRRNLRENGLEPSKLPLVIQYNKRDLPNIRSEEEIKRMAAMGKEPTFLATATHGSGVMETFLGLIGATWEHLEREHGLKDRFGLDHLGVMQDLAKRFGIEGNTATV